MLQTTFLEYNLGVYYLFTANIMLSVVTIVIVAVFTWLVIEKAKELFLYVFYPRKYMQLLSSRVHSCGINKGVQGIISIPIAPYPDQVEEAIEELNQLKKLTIFAKATSEGNVTPESINGFVDVLNKAIESRKNAEAEGVSEE